MSTVNSDLESQTAAVSSNAAAAAPAAAASAGEVVAETPELVARKTDELRELLVENANAEHRSDAFLLRFLRCAKFDAAKAAKRVQRYEMWTQEHLAHAGQLTALRFLSLLESGMFDVTDDVDSTGHVVCVMHYARLDYKKTPSKLVVPGMFYLFERIQQLYPDTNRIGMSALCDCEGMGWAQFDIEVEKLFTDLLQDRIPVRIGTMAMVNAPFLLKAMLSLMKPFLSKKLKQRLLNVGTKYDLLSGFPSSAIPEKYGGRWTEAAADEKRGWVMQLLERECERITLSAARGEHKKLGIIFGEPLKHRRVAKIEPNSFAQEIGICENDLVQSVNGKADFALDGHFDESVAATDDITLDIMRCVRDLYGNELKKSPQFALE